jgi:hypothetical protein
VKPLVEPVPANAISTVCTARARSDEKTTAMPSSRRRSPSSMALRRPVVGSTPGSQPVATPVSLSMVRACVSYTISTAMSEAYGVDWLTG